MFNVFLKVCVAVLVLNLFGCASPMPLKPSIAAIDTQKKSIVVARVSIKNENKPKHHPVLFNVITQSAEGDSKFEGPTLLAEDSDKGKEYFISMDVPPGKMSIKNLIWLRKVPFINGVGSLDMSSSVIDVPANKVVYLGHIDAVIIPRTSQNQPRAGSVIPLIDQAVTGFSSGTFVTKITDNFDQDVVSLRSAYPALKDLDIVKRILPALPIVKVPPVAVKSPDGAEPSTEAASASKN